MTVMKYRKDIRLKEFDYREPRWYFVAVCTREREALFVPKVDTKYSNAVAAGLVPAERAVLDKATTRQRPGTARDRSYMCLTIITVATIANTVTTWHVI
jgi:hypothetical protein